MTVTIRAKLLLLSGILLALLIGSNVYMTMEIVSGRDAIFVGSKTLEVSTASLKMNSTTLAENSLALDGNSNALQSTKETLTRNAETAAKSKLVADLVKVFGDYKYWYADLAVSWQNESEENAETSGELLQNLLGELSKFAPKKSKAMQEQLSIITEKALAAVDKYVDGNRVGGNQLMAATRDAILTVDKLLISLAEELRIEVDAARNSARGNADKAIKLAAAAVEAAIRASGPAAEAVSAADKAVADSKVSVAQAERATSISIWVMILAVVLAGFLTWVIVRSITRPLAGLTDVMRRLADGDKSMDIPY